jgi:Mrp family chromosome partitioning ATPase
VSDVENMKKIAVMSGKGGVGKSTVAANLAFALAQNHKTGLFDVDIHGPSIPKMLGLEDVKGLAESEKGRFKPVEIRNLKVFSIGFLLPTSDTPIIWRGPVKHGFIKQGLEQVDWNADYLIIDLPPGTGDEALSVIHLAKPDGVIIVTTPQSVALEDVRKAIRFAEKTEIPVVGIVENMSGLICPHCSKVIDVFGKGGGRRLSEEMNVTFLGSIPLDPEVTESGDRGRPIVEIGGKTSEVFNKIAETVLDILERTKKVETSQ